MMTRHDSFEEVAAARKEAAALRRELAAALARADAAERSAADLAAAARKTLGKVAMLGEAAPWLFEALGRYEERQAPR